MEPPHPLFFSSVPELRAWFEANHDRLSEAWIGYYKRRSGRAGVTYQQVVEEALCFGWIDGLLRPLGAESYANRYTPRRPNSSWSQRNIQRVQALCAAGRMTPAGLRAFERRQRARTGTYSFESPRPFDASCRAEFRRHPEAWTYFSSQPAHYRRKMAHWVMSGKKAVTRQRRLRQVIDDSAQARWIKGAKPNRQANSPAPKAVARRRALTVPARRR